MKLVVFLPNWLGDLAMATPALRALRKHFGPPDRIVGIMRPKLVGLLDGLDWIDEYWLFDPASKIAEHGRMSLVKRMRRERFDLAVLMSNSFHTALIARLGGSRRRVGYARYGRSLLLTDKLRPSRRGWKILPAPMVDTYLALAETAGCGKESPRLQLAVTPDEAAVGRRIWDALGLRTDGRVVALNNSGAYGTAKRWPLEHCGELARLIAAESDHDVLMICGPGEEAVGREVVARAAHPRVFSLAGQPLGLAATKSCLARCRLMVSTDSGPRHVGAALGLPVVTLLGSTLPVWIDNPEIRGCYVSLKLDCLGCSRRVCPLGHHRCMKDLSPRMVFQSVAGELKKLQT